MSSLWRKIIKNWHPEGIPWPGSVLYNFVSQSKVFGRHYALVAEHVGLFCRKGKVLDIGTGPGWLLVAIKNSWPELELFGVDISPAMVTTAKENMKKAGHGTTIDIRTAPAEVLPFPDDAFSCVVSTGSLHHWKHPVQALNEVHRVLIPGGHALIYDLVRKLPVSVAQAARREFGAFRTRLLWLHSFEEPFYSPQDMEALALGTLFQQGQTQFVGVLCCLVLQKALLAA